MTSQPLVPLPSHQHTQRPSQSPIAQPQPISPCINQLDAAEIDRFAICRRPGARGEWTIGELVLPVPGDVRRRIVDHINAAITHTIHFEVLTFYLGIKLPFELSWSCRRLGAGSLLTLFTDMHACFVQLQQSQCLPSGLLHVATLTQEAFLLFAVESHRFKTASVVKIYKLGALVQSLKDIR
ncbi:hypothetical protein P692DRAFT_20882115 [Suillus brevipes Sb2]|nr:hypothetical protein P692DRAFT_20882115 [Suillus brevipes Sb2]